MQSSHRGPWWISPSRRLEPVTATLTRSSKSSMRRVRLSNSLCPNCAATDVICREKRHRSKAERYPGHRRIDTGWYDRLCGGLAKSANQVTELERLRQLSREMMKKLEPIDELTAEINEMRTERLRESSINCLRADAYVLQVRKRSKSSSGCQQFLCRVIMPKHTRT